MARGGISGGTSQQMTPQQVNMQNRNLILGNAINMWLPIYQNVLTTGVNTVVNIPLRNVGLVKRLLVEIAGTITAGAAETLTATRFNIANFLSNVILTDLSNQTRINTAGWHLHFLASVKRHMAFGSAQMTDSPVNFGSNYPVISAPATFNPTQALTFRMFYEVPVSYGDMDLRGAIYANVVNATFNLQLTVNPNMFTGSAGDPALGVYKSNLAVPLATLGNITVTVLQNFLDQLPIINGIVVLPQLDLGTAYLLNSTQASGLVANQDNPFPYANFRDFMSTIAWYDNFGYATAPVGSDINYWALQSANYTNILKYDPYVASLLTRHIINDDLPAGPGLTTYYFDHRHRPISTIQFGNMQLVANLANVQGSTSALYLGYEALAYINQVTQAGSLYGT
jgi:P3 major capsid protein